MINKKVHHKILGIGVVTHINDFADIITVVFRDKPHKFPYPYAFEKFLAVEDENEQKALLAEIKRKKQQVPFLREKNIETAKDSHKDCPYVKYLNGKYSYDELTNIMSSGGCVCNESCLMGDLEEDLEETY